MISATNTNLKIIVIKFTISLIMIGLKNSHCYNHKNCNFPNGDWFNKLIFSTYSLAKFLSDSLLSDSLISRSHSKLYFKSANRITFKVVVTYVCSLASLFLAPNGPFATNGHMVQNPPYWRASSLLFPHWDIKTKASQA